ncbi:MAG: hypothetical protein HY270_18400 [Deltaproteobacteria bacterium]|nr:hypothetical protein [Deltaproteobacteria bacterium]
MDNSSVARVRYFDHQFLRTQDFVDEQAYHVAMRRRHNIAQHSWGIVVGLDLLVEEEGQALFVAPGMAIDGFGRELIFPQKTGLTGFQAKVGDVVDVWLLYAELPTGAAQPAYAGCGQKSASDRLQEYALVRLQAVEADALPETEKRESDPTLVPTDDIQDEWKVYLGRAQYDANSKRITVSGDWRRYAGLVGQNVQDPASDTRIELGPSKDDAARSFALLANGAACLEVKSDGSTTIAGTTAVQGDVILDGGALALKPGPPPVAGSTDEVDPWTISHFDSNGTAELRIAIGDKSTDRVVVGMWSADDKAFTEILTISGSPPTVTVNGNLTVNGLITGTLDKSADAVPPSEDASAKSFLLGGAASGVSGSNVLLHSFFVNPLLGVTKLGG